MIIFSDLAENDFMKKVLNDEEGACNQDSMDPSMFGPDLPKKLNKREVLPLNPVIPFEKLILDRLDQVKRGEAVLLSKEEFLAWMDTEFVK